MDTERLLTETYNASRGAGKKHGKAKGEATKALAAKRGVGLREAQIIRQRHENEFAPVIRKAQEAAKNISEAADRLWEKPFADLKPRLHADEWEALEKLRPFRTRTWVLEVLRDEIAARDRLAELEARLQEAVYGNENLKRRLRDAELALEAAGVPGWQKRNDSGVPG